MATLVEELRTKLQATRQEREQFAAQFSAEALPTEDDERKLDAMLNGEADLGEELARATKFANAKAGINSGEERPNPAKAGDRPRMVTLGDRFINSEEFKAALAQYAPGGQIPTQGGFKMPALAFKGLQDLGMWAGLVTGDSSTSGGAFVITDRFPELQAIGRRPLNIFDIIRRLQTQSDLVDYVAQSSRTNAAAIVAEATAPGNGTGAAPESAAAFAIRSAAVAAISTFIPVTKRAIADVPQMRGIIDTELRDNVEAALENEIFNGTGTITGIIQTSGTQTQAWDTNILQTTRKAKTLVSTVAFRVPTAYVLNPSDWETIDLLQDNEARYFYGGPSQVGVPRLWGLPVVEAASVAAGGGLVGDFQKCILWDRAAAALSISDSHQDFFTRGLLALLVELRAAFALVQPDAIVEIDTAA